MPCSRHVILLCFVVAAMTPVDEEKTLVVVDEPVAPSPVSCADVDVVATPELPKTPLTIQTTLATTENPGQNLDALVSGQLNFSSSKH